MRLRREAELPPTLPNSTGLQGPRAALLADQHPLLYGTAH